MAKLKIKIIFGGKVTMKNNFIRATKEYCSFDEYVSAPYIRKAFALGFKPKKAQIKICGLGFYRLFINGKDITKGALAPYINNSRKRIYESIRRVYLGF